MKVVYSAQMRGWIASVVVLLLAVAANAADRFSSGTKSWDSSTVNWGTLTTGPYNAATWNNATPDSAVFEGTAGTVTLTENITTTGITFNVTGYTVTTSANEYIFFTTPSTMKCDVAIAVIDADIDTDSVLVLDGTGTGTLNGNFLVGTEDGERLIKQGAGTWIINGVSTYSRSFSGKCGTDASYGDIEGIWVKEGILKVTDYISVGHPDEIFVDDDGQFHWNGTNILINPGGNANILVLAGGRFDNTSGHAITNTAECSFKWIKDSVFIGSQGADSDLYLPCRADCWDGKKLSVSNAAATLTLRVNSYGGGEFGGANGFIKGGDGRLVITSNAVWYGSTTVEAGVLSLAEPYMHWESYVYLTNSGVLDLDFVGTNEVMAVYTDGTPLAAGIWGSTGSGAPNETAWLTGTGRLKVLYGEPVEGKRWWEGGSTDVAGDGDADSTGGAGTWDTTTKNWDCGFPVAHTNWNNSSNDTAYIYGSTGMITLAEDITLGGIYLDADEDGYVITNNTLNFAANSTFTGLDSVTIYSAITGNPAFVMNYGGTGHGLTLDSSSMAIGSINGGGNNYLYLKGTGSSSVTGTIIDARVYKSGPGTWTVKNIITDRNLVVDEGVLKVTGTVDPSRHDLAPALELNGGEFHCNSTNTFDATGATSTKKLDISLAGGWLDNSAGYPITLNMKDDDVQVNISGDFGFLGSGGAASDLDLGTRGTAVLKNGDRTVTVSNAAATFAIGTPIGDGGNGYGIIKEGDGKLRLYGANTYSGDTVVNEGSLELEGNYALSDSGNLWISNTAAVHLPAGVFESVGKLYLDGVLYTNGTWGSTSSGAGNKSDTYFSGTGILNLGAPILYTSGSKTWDTSTANWGVVSGGPYNAVPWPNDSAIIAVFEGAAGTTTISGNITNSGIRFDVTGHTITNTIASDLLVFRDDSTVRCDVVSATISADVSFPEADATLSGTGTGTINGYISAPGGAYGAARLVKEGSGTWIINGGCQNTYQFGAGVDIDGGVLVANAWISVGHTDAVRVNSGGEFHYNKQGVIVRPGGNANNLRLNGGRLDNTGGSAITENTTFSFYVDDDSVFIGSQGANSDIEFIGPCYWTDGKTLTVSNALTTLEFSGVVQSANTTGIIKDGAGTLKLSGVNTFTGDTTVEDGTLSLAGSSALVDSTALRLTNSAGVELDAGVDETVAELYLAGVQAYGGTWGSSSSSAQHRDDSLFSGSGILTVSNGDNITNRPVSSVSDTGATFNGWFKATVTNQDIYVYWGTSNGATTASAWENSAYVGSWTNEASVDITYTNTSLTWGTVYYYAFRASNAVQSVWACPSESFSTIGPPTVDNGTGATTLSETSATLRGELIAGVSADAWICWGNEDAGTDSTSDWDNVVSIGSVTRGVEFATNVTGLATNATYWYRTYATNSDGIGWAATAEVFSGTPVGSGGGGSGNIAVYTHGSSGTAVVNPASGADYDLLWDTTVREDSGYTLGGGLVNVVAGQGHHLILHNARYDSDNQNERREIQQYIISEGATNAIGWAQDYLRKQSGQDECLVSGGGIIELAGDGNISIQAHRTDDQSDDDVDRIADASGFMLMKLDDSWDYCRLSRGSDQTGPTTGTYVPVNYDTQDELDAGSFGHTVGGSNITLKTAGHYLVFANTFLNCGVDRTVLIQRLTLDGTPIEGSTTTVYIRGNQNGCSDGAAALGIIIETSGANQKLRVEGALGVNRSPSLYKANKTAITIAKLPDSGDYIRLGDSGAEDLNAPTAFPLGWDAEDEIDAGGFTHSDSNITAAVDDDYLFLTALYEANDGGQRSYNWQRWSTNGAASPVTYANAGGIGRDNSGADEVGDFSGILLEMANGDTIQVISEALGAAGTWSGVDSKGCQGVRIGSIMAGGGSIANLAPTSITNDQATLNATLSAAETNYTVYVHWGTTDGGTNLGSWDIYHKVGSWTNVASTNISYLKTGLTQNTPYWYTFRGSNDAGNIWAEPSWSFTTPAGSSDEGSVFMFK